MEASIPTPSTAARAVAPGGAATEEGSGAEAAWPSDEEVVAALQLVGLAGRADALLERLAAQCQRVRWSSRSRTRRGSGRNGMLMWMEGGEWDTMWHLWCLPVK